MNLIDKYFPVNQAIERFTTNEEVKDFNKILDIFEISNRTINILDINEDSGTLISSYIRLWNMADEEYEKAEEERTPIKIYIDSSGGDLVSTLSIVDSIRLSKTPITTINISKAYSGGLLIFLAGHHRIAYPNSSFLFHEGSTSSQGDAHKFQNQADFYKKQREQIKNIVLTYTSISEETYESNRKDDWWFNAAEAITLGVADEIASNLI